MSQHLQPIYAVWGGNAEALAADIGELGVTVRQWRNRGDIPARAWPKIIKAAAAKGEVLRLEDFLLPEAKSELPTDDPSSHATAPPHEWPLPSPDAAEVGVGPFPDAAADQPPRSPPPPARVQCPALSPPPSSPTCSPTSAPSPPSAASPASSIGRAA